MKFTGITTTKCLIHGKAFSLVPTDTILWYVKDRNRGYCFHPLEEPREKAVKQLQRVKVNGKMINARDEDGNVLYSDRTESCR